MSLARLFGDLVKMVFQPAIEEIAKEERRRYSVPLVAFESFKQVAKHFITDDTKEGTAVLNALEVLGVRLE